jgi:hypothetical protein
MSQKHDDECEEDVRGQRKLESLLSGQF